MHPPLFTPSLLLRPFDAADAGALFSFMGNASAMQHTYVAPTLEHCATRLSAYEARRAFLGHAPWVVREISTNDVVGWGGLSLDLDEPDWGLEVSYAFAPSAWGRGYATELVQASLGHALSVLRAPVVHAFAKPENAASVRVLEKCGFRFLRHEPSLQRDHFVVQLHQSA